MRADNTFYVGMSGALLLIVLMGFSRTLYLRVFFDVPSITALVWLHGVVLTAWFVAFFLQTTFVAAHRVDIHRRVGWIVAGLAFAVLTITLAVTLNFVAGRRAPVAGLGAGVARSSAVVWGDLCALVAFAVLLPAAIAFRRRPETHKRLMVLASISMIQPAISRISRWPVFGGTDASVFSVTGLIVLVLALALYDVASRKRVHAVTLLVGSLLMGSRVIAVFVVAASEFGRSFVRGFR